MKPPIAWKTVLPALWILAAVLWLQPVPCVNAQSTAQGQSSADAADGFQALRHGNFSKAAELFEKDLALCDPLTQPAACADSLIGLAMAYQDIGQYAPAMEKLRTALKICERADDKSRMAIALARLGYLHYLESEEEKAADLLNQGLKTAREIQNPEIISEILNYQGDLLAGNQQYDAALKAYLQSAREADPAGNSVLSAKARVNAAKALCRLKDYDHAQSELKTAYDALALCADHIDSIYTLISIGQVMIQMHELKGQKDSGMLALARDAFRCAQDAAESLNNDLAASYAVGNTGRLYEMRQRFEEALVLTRRATFLAQKVRIPEAMYRWQWQTGRLLKKLNRIDDAVLAYQQAVYSLEMIREDLSSDCRKRVRLSFQETVGPVYYELADLLLERSALHGDPALAQQDLVSARQTMETLKAFELQDFFQDECVTSLSEKLTDLESVSSRAAAIYPIIFPDRLELLVSLPRGMKRYRVPVSAETLKNTVSALRWKLEKPWRRYSRYAGSLYQWIIAPIENDLKDQRVDTLVFIPDGILRTIPAAALYDGERFLIEKYAVATTPGLSLTDPRPLKRDNPRALLAGLSESVQGFPALPNVSAELDSLEKIYPCKLLKDAQFTVDGIQKALASTPYAIVHIASHGQFENDRKNTFLLAHDQKLTIDDLERFMEVSRFREEPVELLTLSACQTAAGDDRAALGLAGIALKAGARSALASLWFINDAAAARLVAEFYLRIHQDPGVSKAQALQQAQIKLLADESCRHPAFWAPFLVIGNWL